MYRLGEFFLFLGKRYVFLEAALFPILDSADEEYIPLRKRGERLRQLKI